MLIQSHTQNEEKWQLMKWAALGVTHWLRWN